MLKELPCATPVILVSGACSRGLSHGPCHRSGGSGGSGGSAEVLFNTTNLLLEGLNARPNLREFALCYSRHPGLRRVFSGVGVTAPDTDPADPVEPVKLFRAIFVQQYRGFGPSRSPRSHRLVALFPGVQQSRGSGPSKSPRSQRLAVLSPGVLRS